MMHLLRRLLYAGHTTLREYEAACLTAWRERLPVPGQHALQLQLARFDMLQRLSNDRLVTFHDSGDKSYESWPDTCFFVTREPEQIVATVHVGSTSSSGRSTLRADIVLHRGRLSSIEFDRPPRSVFPRSPGIVELKNGASWAGAHDVTVSDIKLHLDPMRPGAPATEMPLEEARLTGWLRDLAEQGSVQSLHRPLPAESRLALVERVDARIPADYLDDVAQAEGFRIGSCSVLGVSEIRKIVLPDQAYYVLAEINGGGVIGVAQGSASGELFLLDEGDVPQLLDMSFRAAVERACERADRGKAG